MFLEVQISLQAQHLVKLHVQISWQVQHFVKLHAQISWQAQYKMRFREAIEPVALNLASNLEVLYRSERTATPSASSLDSSKESEPVMECRLELTTLSGTVVEMTTSVAKYDRLELPGARALATRPNWMMSGVC